jgi:lipid-binding SYLF domain-containing protein
MCLFKKLANGWCTLSTNCYYDCEYKHLEEEVFMKSFLLLAWSAVVLFSLTACLSPTGDTPDQKRAAILNMHNETLTQLYKQRPSAENIVSKAAGYAVFSNVNALYLFVGGGGGYGVVVNNSSGQKTYMKMAQVDLGLGLGVQDIRVVFAFHSERALNGFVNSGWEFGGQADAAAKARDKGIAATGEVSIDAETTMYTMSESGLMAKVNLAGTKYWKDDNLNN